MTLSLSLTILEIAWQAKPARMATVLAVLFGSSVAAAALGLAVIVGQGSALGSEGLMGVLLVFAGVGVGLSVFHLVVVHGVCATIDDAQRRARLQPFR